MGTEILHPQDILVNERLKSVHAFYPRQRHHHHHHHHHHTHFTNPKSTRKLSSSSPSPPRKQENKRRPSKQEKVPNPDAAGSPGKNLVMGQVTILKRGESLDSKRNLEFPHKTDLKKSVSLTESDLIVCGVERLGPDPELVPKRIAVLSPAIGRSDGVYAGSAFSQSPSPSSLPLPRFSKKKEGGGAAIPTAAVDDWATKDLRRLLRLD